MQQKSITTDFDRSPDSNTLLYMPLNSQTTKSDTSSHSRTTTQGGTVRYGTYGGVNCADFTSAGNISVSTWQIPSSYTVLVRCYNVNGYDSSDGKIVDFRITNGNETVLWYGTSGRGSSKGGYFGNSTKNKRFLMAYSVSNGVGTGYLKGDGVNLTTSGASGFVNNQTPTAFNIGNEYNNASGTPRHFLGYISRVVVQNGNMSATQITAYYDKTKKKFGIS